jgi:hypothetical protein
MPLWRVFGYELGSCRTSVKIKKEPFQRSQVENQSGANTGFRRKDEGGGAHGQTLTAAHLISERYVSIPLHWHPPTNLRDDSCFGRGL